ncbi:MAG: site-specific integrase [Bacteroidota bacterium]
MSLKIHFYIRPEKAKTNGEAPVYLRLTAHGRKAHSLKKYIAPHKWDSVRYCSKGKKREDVIFNQHIRNVTVALTQIENSLLGEGKKVTAQRVLDMYRGKSLHGHTFVGTFQEHIAKLEKTVDLPDGISPRTVGKYRTVLKHFTDYLMSSLGVSDIALDDLRYRHIEDFVYYLKTERKIQNNTRVKYIYALRGIIKGAVRKGKLDRDPFIQWQGRVITKDRVYLTIEEVHRLQAKVLQTKRLAEVRDVFIFSCYTGLAYIDAFNLTEDHIVETQGQRSIRTFRQKTNALCSIPLLEEADTIIARYADSEYRKIYGRLLPVKSNQKVNSYIQELAAICGIDKHLTFHVARHTFATTILLANDVPLETVKELLGHKHMSTTQHYSKMGMKKIQRDMALLADRLKKNRFDT